MYDQNVSIILSKLTKIVGHQNDIIYRDYIISISVVIAIFTLVYQLYIHNKQLKMQTFFHYTERYQNILINLPIDIESNNFQLNSLKKEEKEEILKWLRAYFDLCSEEYYLYNRKLIDDSAWTLWHAGIKISLQKSAFRDGWNEIQKNDYYNLDFATYIESIIKKDSNIKPIKNEKLKSRSKFQAFFDFVLDVKKEDLRLKFFFDNIRNYGLVAVLWIAAKYLFYTKQFVIFSTLGNQIFASILIIYGFLLFVFNAVHPIAILVKFKNDFGITKVSYVILSTITFLSAYSLFFSILFSK